MARKYIQLHFVPTVPVRRHPFCPGSFTPSPAFTMADLRVHDDRSARSRWPIFAFTMTDLAVHDGPIFAFTMARNSQFVDKAGKTEVVNYELENGTYVIQNKVLRPGEKLRLVLGKQQAWIALK